MGIEAKNLKLYVRKCLLFPFKISYRLTRDRPFSLGMVIFLHILHKHCPALFAFLVSSSPVFVCTALLLGVLLLYGELDVPETKEAHAKHRTKVKGNEVKEDDIGSTGAGIRAVEDVPTTSVHGDCVEKSETFASARSLVVEGNEETHGERRGNNARELHNQGFHKRSEISKGKQAEGAVKVSEAVGPIETVKSDLETHFGYSPGSSCQPLESHGSSSRSGSEEAEDSSPDASVADIIPMLDELHPLLDSEAPLAAHISNDNFDAASSRASQDNESGDDSVEEEAEIQEDEEDEEAQEEKDDTIEAVVTWTADDQKNLMDLGSSELERNQRLENLLAKRRAKKFLSFHAVNLIDLDSNDPMPNMDDVFRFQNQIPPISAPRHNPFDLPFDTEENMGLPPIPGSAPSVLQPRQNPFDLPFDQLEQSNSPTRETMNHQEFALASQRDVSYWRHESITLGASFSGDCKVDSHDSKLKPYFVPERMDMEGTGLAVLQRQSSEKSDSKVSSENESDTSSSIVGQEDHRELLEVFHQENHLQSPENHYAELVEQGSQSSEEVNSVGNEHEDVDDDDDDAIQLNSSVVAEENYQAGNAFGAAEMEIRQGESHSPDSHSENLEVIEDMYDDSSSLSSEVYEKNSKNDSKDFSESMLSVPADSGMRNATERLDESQPVDPVYDSSPSAVEKSLPNMPKFDESSLYAGKEFNSSISMTSDVQLGSSELDPCPVTHEKKVPLEESDFASVSRNKGENLSSDTTEVWVAPPSLASVDEIESRMTEVTEINEHDVIRAVIQEDLGHPIVPVLTDVMYPSHLSTADSDFSKDTALEADVMTSAAASSDSSELGVQQIEKAGVKDSDVSASKDSGVGKEHEGMIDPPASPSFNGLQQIEEREVGLSANGDKLEAHVSESSSSSTLEKI